MQCQAKAKSSGKQCNRRAVEGKRVCTVHGGLTPGGIASPHFKTGRYSKYIPARLAEKYQEAIADQDILSLNEDVALVRSFVFKHLSDIAGSDTHPAWIEAKKAFDEMDIASAAGELEKFIAAKNKLGDIIEPHYRAAMSEGKVVSYIDQLSKLADKERRLLIDRQQVITVERMMLMITAIATIVRENVSDRQQLNAIQNGIQRLVVIGA